MIAVPTVLTGVRTGGPGVVATLIPSAWEGSTYEETFP